MNTTQAVGRLSHGGPAPADGTAQATAGRQPGSAELLLYALSVALAWITTLLGLRWCRRLGVRLLRSWP